MFNKFLAVVLVFQFCCDLYCLLIQDELLAELDEQKNTKELAVMDLCHNMEKATEKLEDGCSFTEHVLNNGSTLQLLLLKNIISTQMKSLMSSLPSVDVDVNIEFKTDTAKFEEALNKTFGHFKKEEENEETKVNCLKLFRLLFAVKC